MREGSLKSSFISLAFFEDQAWLSDLTMLYPRMCFSSKGPVGSIYLGT